VPTMAKKNRSSKTTLQPPLPELTPVPRQLVTYLVNNLVLGDYDRCCSTEAIAKALRKPETRLKNVIGKLAEQGWLEVERGNSATAYPTLAAVMQLNPSLPADEAKRLLKRARA
jgi:predicted transcriptional regulator